CVDAICCGNLGVEQVEPDVLRLKAQQLLAFSEKLAASARSSGTGSSKGPGRADAPKSMEAQEAEGRGVFFCCLLLVVSLTLPYYVCITYTSWFVDEAFAIYRNPDARGETPIVEVLR
ncbi:unnamed protein product, partial [Polarella glacialis]